MYSSFHIIKGKPESGVLFLCDHATNYIPNELNNLGLEQDQLERHIAYDIGAKAVTEYLASTFSSPAVTSNFSRLLIDPNRSEIDPTLIMRISDGAFIPENAYHTEIDREYRLETYYRPYHRAIETEIKHFLDRGIVPILVSIHSFTPIWRGTQRPWHLGLLWDKDDRVSKSLMTYLEKNKDVVIGDNEPYLGALLGDCMYRHGTQAGLPHTLIEIRQDLIDSDEGVTKWSSILAEALKPVIADEHLHQIEHIGSRLDKL